MNKDHVKGAAKDMAGKVQREYGKMTDNPSHEAKGMAKQAEGKIQKKVGDVKDEVKDIKDDAREQNRDIERDG